MPALVALCVAGAVAVGGAVVLLLNRRKGGGKAAAVLDEDAQVLAVTQQQAWLPAFHCARWLQQHNDACAAVLCAFAV